MALAFGLTLLCISHTVAYGHDLPIELDSTTTAAASKPAPEVVPRGVDLCAIFAFMFIAASLSGLIGIGPAAVQIIEMERSTQRPDSVFGTTAHFLIGITAAVSGSVYLQHGYMDSELAIPLMCGVYCGSFFWQGEELRSASEICWPPSVRRAVDGPLGNSAWLPRSSKSTS